MRFIQDLNLSYNSDVIYEDVINENRVGFREAFSMSLKYLK